MINFFILDKSNVGPSGFATGFGLMNIAYREIIDSSQVDGPFFGHTCSLVFVDSYSI